MLKPVKCATCGNPNGFILTKTRTWSAIQPKHTCFACEWKVGAKAGYDLVKYLRK